MTEQKQMSQTAELIKNALILFVITLVAGVALGAIYEMTKAEISRQEVQAVQEANQAVFADANAFPVLEIDESAWSGIVAGNSAYGKVKLLEVKEARAEEGGDILGYVINVASGGYSSDITFSIGLTMEGHMNGISIISIAESPGLGMEADPVLVPQFVNNGEGRDDMPFSLVTVGDAGEGQIKAITAATITSRAVTNGVNAGVEYFNTVLRKGAQ